jgi:4-diphosphocytidyl-2-C-methyl-D-erythritol kinase
VSRGRAFAKINLALVVGPRRTDGKHEVVTVLQRIDLHDDIEVEPADALVVDGFAEDTIVHEALLALADAVGVAPRWRVRIAKRTPVAAGLGGGSSDAATALQLANAALDEPRSPDELHRIGARIGADVPFFLRVGAQLATGDGTELTQVELPSDYWVVLVMPAGAAKESTGKIYAAFDERGGADGFEERADGLRLALGATRASRDLARLPANDLASSPLSRELLKAGAFRADVSGAGPTVYGLFDSAAGADSAAASLRRAGRTLVARPLGADDLPRVAR